MADGGIVLPRSRDAALDRYGHLLRGHIDEHSELVPLDALPALRAEIQKAVSLAAASLDIVGEAVATLMGSMKIGNVIDDRSTFTLAMIQELHGQGYPPDILKQAVRRVRRTMAWLPAISEMIELCDELSLPWRQHWKDLLYSISCMEMEHRWRPRRAAEREAEAAREAERERQWEAAREREGRWIAEQEALAPKHFGDEAPRKGDLKLLVVRGWPPPQCSRQGRPVSWRDALANGEHWAARFVRQCALLVRVSTQHEQGCVSDESAVGIATLIVSDEESAADQILKIEMWANQLWPRYRLLPNLDRAVRAIKRGCGLDTETDPPNARQNAETLEKLAALGDTREVLERQAQEEWEARRA